MIILPVYKHNSLRGIIFSYERWYRYKNKISQYSFDSPEWYEFMNKRVKDKYTLITKRDDE